jgi:hypothetical protein
MKTNKTFIIRDKVTHEPWYGTKTYKQIGHAKNAFIQRKVNYSSRGGVSIDDQDKYEIVEVVSESEIQLKEALQLLKEVVTLNSYDGIPAGQRVAINKFLRSCGEKQ